MPEPGLEALTDAFLDEEFEANPVAASGLGLTAYDARLDDLSATAFEARDAVGRALAGPPRGPGPGRPRRPPRRSIATCCGPCSAGD